MKRKPLILTSLLLAAFVINLDTTIVNVALPTLVRQLHASNSQLQWVVDAFNLFFAGSVLAAGSLSDRLGRKGMLLAGLTVFGLASLAGGLIDSPDGLIAARAVMGVGAAMVFPSTLSLLTNVFTERQERALAIGLWGAITGVAIALGPIVGGWLLELSDWRSIFFAMIPIAAGAGVLVAGYVPTSRDPRTPRIDLAGFALSTATIGLLVYTIIEAPSHGWESPRTLAGFALTGVLATAFAGWERRTKHPMLDVNLFRNPRFTAASGSVAISFFALSGFIFLVTQYFQFLKGYGPLSTGVRLLPVATQSSRPPRSSAPSSPSGSAPSWSSRPGCSRWPSSISGSRLRRPRPATGRSPPRWSCSGQAWASPARPRPRRSWASCRRRRPASARRSTTPHASSAAPSASP